MASKAGAVAIAKAVEDDLAKLAAASRKGSIAEGEKPAVAAIADGTAGNSSGTEESKEAGVDASQQPPDAAAAAAAGQTSAATNQAAPAGALA